jgi:hypothetical protein
MASFISGQIITDSNSSFEEELKQSFEHIGFQGKQGESIVINGQTIYFGLTERIEYRNITIESYEIPNGIIIDYIKRRNR